VAHKRQVYDRCRLLISVKKKNVDF